MRLRQSDLSARALPGETIVLDLRTSRYLSATGTGTRILELLAEERSLDDLVATVSAEYAADPERVRTDTRLFVDRLRGAGLLEG